MATLEELRVELDKIDNQMVELYQKRMNVCREVAPGPSTEPKLSSEWT